jgi:diguanylate cyclase (GGDEF)-like protein
MDQPDRGPSPPVDEARLLRAALEVSRITEPTGCANALVIQAGALVEAAGGFFYLRPADGSEHQLLGCHIGPEDARRKGLVRLPLESILGGPGFRGADREFGPCPPLFQAFPIETLLSLAAEDREFRGRLLIGLPAGRNEAEARAALEVLERFLLESFPALANALRIERVRELVIKDDQTDSYNRRHLDSSLFDEVERARRYGTVLSLIFMDLDNLKEVNRLHGHAAGSRALRGLSRRVINAIRGSDKLFRYGGDEFCVVLPETDTVGAYELAERLRATIAARPFDLEGNLEVALTASVGVACFPQHADSVAALLAAADQAMSRVKQSGKNSIGVGTGREPDAGSNPDRGTEEHRP